MEAHPTFERADGGVELHAPRAVDLDLIAVIHPGHAELDHALWLYEALKQRHLTITRVFFKEGPQSGHHFTYGLRKLTLMRVALLNMGKETFQRTCLIHRYKNPLWCFMIIAYAICVVFLTIPPAPLCQASRNSCGKGN